jgi:putative two-component system response regulator
MLQLKSYQDQICDQNKQLEQRVKERTFELELSHREIIYRLAKAGEFRDEDTGYHIKRVGLYSCLLAQRLGMDDLFCDLIQLTSPLHDIGKIGIPDEILHKPGVLSDEEREIMKTHCRIGVSILRTDSPFISVGGNSGLFEARENDKNSLLEMAATIALSHHERWDGSGYPEGKTGQDIPLEARIVALADVYDSLRSPRPYKVEYSARKSRGIIKNNSGKHFDPQIVAVFREVHEEMDMIFSECRQSTRETGKEASQ